MRDGCRAVLNDGLRFISMINSWSRTIKTQHTESYSNQFSSANDTMMAGRCPGLTLLALVFAVSLRRKKSSVAADDCSTLVSRERRLSSTLGSLEMRFPSTLGSIEKGLPSKLASLELLLPSNVSSRDRDLLPPSRLSSRERLRRGAIVE